MSTQKSKKVLSCRGYIFSRKINDNFIPQRVQNLVIKDFAKRKNNEGFHATVKRDGTGY